MRNLIEAVIFMVVLTTLLLLIKLPEVLAVVDDKPPLVPTETTVVKISTVTRMTDIKEQVFQMTDKAGMNRVNVNAVITCESNWNPKAISKTTDVGLWQINNLVHILPGSISWEQALDVQESTNYAILLWQKHGFSPWVCAHKLGIV